MEAQPLTDLIRSGYQQPAAGELVETLTARRQRERLERHLLLARHDPHALDALLLEVIANYRSGARQVWAPFLLEVLAPALGASLGRYEGLEPYFSEEDIHQQLVVELLEAALELDFPPGCRFVDRRLLNRASFRLNRQLERELRRQRRQLVLPEPDPEEREQVEPADAETRAVMNALLQQQLDSRGLKQVTISEAKARRLLETFGPLAAELINGSPEIRVRKKRRR